MIDGFENIIWIIGGIIGVIIATFFFSKYKSYSNFVDIKLLEEVYKKNSLWYKIYVSILWIISVLFFVVMAWPYSTWEKQTIQKNGIDVEIVLDLSYSMSATDLKPNRIDAAKQVITEFVWELSSDRVGLILFAGKPFQSIPLSYDYTFLTQFISDIHLEMIDQSNPQLQWTAIWDALVLASDALDKKNTSKQKVIILITDGEANKWLEPLIALKLLKEKNIKTYTIGVGKSGDTTVDVPVWRWLIQRVLIGWVDEEILKKIAQETWGKYFRADSKNTFKQILDTISLLEKSTIETEIYKYHTSKKWIIFLILDILLLCIAYILFIKKIKI